MADEKIQIEIDLAVSKAVDKRFKDLERGSAKAGAKAGRGFQRGFEKGTSRALSSIKTKLLGIGALLGTAFFTKGAVQAAAGFEKIETQLKTLTGSAEAASLVFEELKEFSAETPFQLGDIARASARLISFGFSAGTVRDRIKEIGEVAAGSGSDLGELALIFGQVQAAGKLTGERLLQLQERAVPIGPAIAKTLGIAESSVRDFVKEGKITADVFQTAFRSLSAEGGIFAGSLQRQSKTIGGIFSTLADNAKIFQAEIGKAFGPAIIDSAQQFIRIFQEVGKAVAANGPELARTLKSISDVLIITPSKFWLEFFAGNAKDNIGELNAEIERTDKIVNQLQKDFEKQKGSAFSRFIGADQETAKLLGDELVKLTELKKRRDALLEAQNKNTDAVREELAVKARAKQEATADAERLKAQEQSLKARGDIGLQREQVLRNQAQRDLELIKTAEENKAITEQEAAARRFERERMLEEQLTTLKQQENQKREQARKQALEQELAAEQSLADILGNTSKRFQDVAKDFRVTSRDVAKSLISGFGTAATNAFASFGRAIATGEDALDAFGKALIGAFGSALVQLGTGFILQGIAQSIAGFGSGAPLIAAGAALATFGGVLQGVAGGGGGVSSAGAGGGIGNDGGFGEATAQTEELEEPGTRVSVTVQGDVFDSDETGIRIANILEQASLNQNVTVVGAA